VSVELSLQHYIERKQWLFLLFIPAAFSFVCPTEVLAFHNTIDEFTERNCAIAFVSTDSKHSLWQWQQLPKKYGGLGKVKVPLLSDQSHQMSRDYGVLLEKSGMDLRGSYLIDPEGVVQQVTINNIAVGRSVLESLRLVEAFQAVMEKGVLCPANWKPGGNMLDEEETYAEREEQITKDFQDNLQIKDLDHNVNVPFTLTLPQNAGRTSNSSSRGSSRGAAATRNGSPGSAVTAIHRGSSTADHPNAPNNSSTSKRSSCQSGTHPKDLSIVTLDFADPLTGGSGGSASPNEFVDLSKRLSHHDLNGSGRHGRSPSASSQTSSTTTATQRTVEALKRISGIGSPKVETPRSAAELRTGYFD
jgi:alkyl hydroperoxide reductase subunit AhpC